MCQGLALVYRSGCELMLSKCRRFELLIKCFVHYEDAKAILSRGGKRVSSLIPKLPP